MPIIVISMHLVLASYLTPVFSSYSCPVIHVSCLPSNIFTHNELYLVGGFNPSEHISQWEGLSHILWKIKNDPNHQPDIVGYTCYWHLLNLTINIWVVMTFWDDGCTWCTWHTHGLLVRHIFFRQSTWLMWLRQGSRDSWDSSKGLRVKARAILCWDGGIGPTAGYGTFSNSSCIAKNQATFTYSWAAGSSTVKHC